MAQTIYLTPASGVPMNITQLAMWCKSQLLSMLFVRIIGEDLRPNTDGKVFTAKYANWQDNPKPRVTAINALGIETLKFETTDYVISSTGGTITFPSTTTDTIRADYNYFPFTEQQLSRFGLQALREISVLTYRPIDVNCIHFDYAAAICKRIYTLVLKALLIEARDYFSVSVGGRSINKTNVVAQLNAIIEQNEKQLQDEINVLRTFNKTNRILPKFTGTDTIQSNSQIN
jgi:hypothetical protein